MRIVSSSKYCKVCQNNPWETGICRPYLKEIDDKKKEEAGYFILLDVIKKIKQQLDSLQAENTSLVERITHLEKFQSELICSAKPPEITEIN